MTSNERQASIADLQPTSSTRLASIDIFRGLTMTVMIFVNELSGIKGLPWWTHHAEASVDVMTYVDMVFPFFLFIVGLSMPLALRARLKKNPSPPALWGHVALRTASLMVLGLILANADAGDAHRMGINPGVWAICALLGAGLFLNLYPVSLRYAKLFRGLRVVGLLVVVVAFTIFRQSPHPGQSAWIDFSYPEILGIIGYTYLAVSVLYIPLRRWLAAPMVLFVVMLGLNIVTAAKILTIDKLPYYFWPFSNGSFAALVLAGIVTSNIFLGTHRWQSLRQKMTLALSFAALALLGGWLAIPLGISKIRATPTWTLWSIGAAVLCFSALYWICDVKRSTSWANFVRPAGANTLTTYLLPDLWFYLMLALGVEYFGNHLSSGWQGVVRCAVFTGLILALSGLLTKARVRLQL